MEKSVFQQEEESKRMIEYLNDITLASEMSKSMVKADGEKIKNRVILMKILEGIRITCDQAITKIKLSAQSINSSKSNYFH